MDESSQGAERTRSRKQQRTRPIRDGKQSEAIEEIRVAIEGIRFGVVQVIIQDGRVIQIDRTEKTRLV